MRPFTLSVRRLSLVVALIVGLLGAFAHGFDTPIVEKKKKDGKLLDDLLTPKDKQKLKDGLIRSSSPKPASTSTPNPCPTGGLCDPGVGRIVSPVPPGLGIGSPAPHPSAAATATPKPGKETPNPCYLCPPGISHRPAPVDPDAVKVKASPSPESPRP
jgi:hypothetical protein